MTSEQVEPDRTPEEKATQLVNPEYDSAIRRNSASFVQIVEVWYGKQEKFNKDEATRLSSEWYYPKLMEAFRAGHGGITYSYFCSNLFAAVVLTANNELEIVHPVGKALDVEELLFKCSMINVEVRRLLKGRDLRTCLEMTYSVTSNLLGVLDTKAGETGDADDGGSQTRALRLLNNEVTRIEKYYIQSAERSAQIDYFIGMLWGVLAVVIVATGVGIALSLTDISGHVLRSIIGCLLAGGAGALVSVMSRMTFGGLNLNYEAGSKLLRLMGAFRPLIGSLLGAALFLSTASGLLPVATPTDPSKQQYFYPAIGFLAGFSERWAQDMLVVARRRVTPNAEEERR